MNKRSGLTTTSFFTLVVFGIFALCSLILVTIGGNAYGKIVSNIDDDNNLRATFSYIFNRVRQNDVAGNIKTEQFDDISALSISSTREGISYKTYIYEYGGFIRETYIEKDKPFYMGDGQIIAESHNFSVKIEKNILTISSNQKIPLEMKLSIC